MQWRCAVLYAAVFSLVFPAGSAAQDVTLTSRDGQTEIAGTLLSFDGEFYRLDTVYGELTVDGSGVRCSGPGCPNLQDFVANVAISGSASMGAVLVPALLESFALREGYRVLKAITDETHREYRITTSDTQQVLAIFRFRLTTSDEGFADLLADEADIIMSLREVRADEIERAMGAGIGDLTARNRAQVLALDALVPIVSPENPVREISHLDMARIYAGEIANWAELGGPDAPIALHAPDTGSGLWQVLAQSVLAPAVLEVAKNVNRHIALQSLTSAVISDPFAFGVTSYAEISGAQPLVLKGACGRELRVARRSVKTEDYPLTAPMFLYTPARRLPKVAREFLAFARSSEAQVVVRRAGFVDQAFEEIPVDEQGDRFLNAIEAAGPEVPLSKLQRMVELLRPLKRLTLSFRFEAGSARLDAQSRSNVTQLARAMDQGRFDARQLYFIGFSDGAGPAQSNQRIARERAEAVRLAVRQASDTISEDQVDVRVAAFGEALPLFCDDSAWGRKTNRRVEVWVR